MRDVAIGAEDAEVIHVLGGRGAIAGVPQFAEAADALAVPWIWVGVLEFALDVQPTSRLSCQIKVDESLDGLVVSVPGQ